MATNFRAPNISVRGGTARKGSNPFSAEIDKWVNKTKQRLDLVVKLAVFRLSQTMQKTVHEGGWLPYREGYLRASLVVTYGGDAPRANRRKENSSRNYDENQTRARIFAARPGELIRLSYTINYARTLEFSGNHVGFVMRSAQRWPIIFSAAVQEAKGMIK